MSFGALFGAPPWRTSWRTCSSWHKACRGHAPDFGKKWRIPNVRNVGMHRETVVQMASDLHWRTLPLRGGAPRTTPPANPSRQHHQEA